MMVMENGATYCAIKQVFGLDFLTSKMVSCQMHYKNNVYRASFRIGVSFRDEFKYTHNEMCTVATVAQYSEQKH